MKLDFEKIMNFPLGHEDEVREICSPLFQYTDIDVFEYKVIYYDGYMIDLNTISKMVPVYFEERLFPDLSELQSLQTRYAFLSVDIGVPQLLNKNKDKWNKNIDLLKNSIYNVSHRFYIMESTLEYFEFCGFGTSKSGAHVLDYFISHVEYFEKFRVYFKQKAHNLILEHKMKPVILPIDLKNLNHKKTSKFNIKQFLQAIELDQFYVNDVLVTKREAQCVCHTVKGLSSKEISRKLGISNRTVEKHLESAKSKLGCTQKSQLRDKFNESELAIILPDEKG